MATDTVDSPTAPAAPAIVDSPPSAPLRLGPVALALAVFFAFFFGNSYLEMSMFTRFVSRLAAHAILLVGFLGWWMTRRSIGFRERAAAVGVFVIGGVATLYVADPTINIWAILLGAMPFVFAAWIVALYLARRQSATKRQHAVWAAILLVLSYWTLIRADGLEGWQRGELSWRWAPTAEERFLAEHGSVFHSVANSPGAWMPRPGDVPGFRGANRDGIARGTKLALDWSKTPPKQIWRQRIGPGWSSLIVVDGRIVTQEQRDEAEVVACYDAATGAEIWVHENPVRFYEGLSGAGPRGTPVFDGGRIYALGGKGNLNGLDAASGKLLWSRDLVADAAAIVPQWGFSVSPLVVDGKVIVFAPGKDALGLVAYDAESGEKQWNVASDGDTYSSPQLVEFDGVRQILMHDNRGLRAVRPGDGKLLWERAAADENALPMLQPNAVGASQLLVSAGSGVTLLDGKHDGGKWTVNDVWSSNRLKPGFNDFVVHRGKIYGLDDGILCALELATGERLWKKGRYGHGQVLLLADQDALLVEGARGEVVLMDISGEQPEELGKFQAIEGKTWNHPALVANRLYLRNGEEIACYELPVAE